MKILIYILLSFGLFSFSAVAQSGQMRVSFSEVRCNLFGQLKVNFEGIRRTAAVYKNGLRCKTAKESLMNQIQNKGNQFVAVFEDRVTYNRRCSRDDDGYRRCEVRERTHRIYEILELRMNGEVFWAKSFLRGRRVR